MSSQPSFLAQADLLESIPFLRDITTLDLLNLPKGLFEALPKPCNMKRTASGGPIWPPALTKVLINGLLILHHKPHLVGKQGLEEHYNWLAAFIYRQTRGWDPDALARNTIQIKPAEPGKRVFGVVRNRKQISSKVQTIGEYLKDTHWSYVTQGPRPSRDHAGSSAIRLGCTEFSMTEPIMGPSGSADNVSYADPSSHAPAHPHNMQRMHRSITPVDLSHISLDPTSAWLPPTPFSLPATPNQSPFIYPCDVPNYEWADPRVLGYHREDWQDFAHVTDPISHPKRHNLEDYAFKFMPTSNHVSTGHARTEPFAGTLSLNSASISVHYEPRSANADVSRHLLSGTHQLAILGAQQQQEQQSPYGSPSLSPSHPHLVVPMSSLDSSIQKLISGIPLLSASTQVYLVDLPIHLPASQADRLYLAYDVGFNYHVKAHINLTISSTDRTLSSKSIETSNATSNADIQPDSNLNSNSTSSPQSTPTPTLKHSTNINANANGEEQPQLHLKAVSNVYFIAQSGVGNGSDNGFSSLEQGQGRGHEQIGRMEDQRQSQTPQYAAEPELLSNYQESVLVRYNRSASLSAPAGGGGNGSSIEGSSRSANGANAIGANRSLIAHGLAGAFAAKLWADMVEEPKASDADLSRYVIVQKIVDEQGLQGQGGRPHVVIIYTPRVANSLQEAIVKQVSREDIVSSPVDIAALNTISGSGSGGGFTSSPVDDIHMDLATPRPGNLQHIPPIQPIRIQARRSLSPSTSMNPLTSFNSHNYSPKARYSLGTYTMRRSSTPTGPGPVRTTKSFTMPAPVAYKNARGSFSSVALSTQSSSPLATLSSGTSATKLPQLPQLPTLSNVSKALEASTSTLTTPPVSPPSTAVGVKSGSEVPNSSQPQATANRDTSFHSGAIMPVSMPTAEPIGHWPSSLNSFNSLGGMDGMGDILPPLVMNGSTGTGTEVDYTLPEAWTYNSSFQDVYDSHNPQATSLYTSDGPVGHASPTRFTFDATLSPSEYVHPHPHSHAPTHSHVYAHTHAHNHAHNHAQSQTHDGQYYYTGGTGNLPSPVFAHSWS